MKEMTTIHKIHHPVQMILFGVFLEIAGWNMPAAHLSLKMLLPPPAFLRPNS